MSTADELFMGVNPEEPHIVVREDRVIIVPDDLKTIAVQHDHNIETITFDCPRYWDGHDLSELDIKINYKLSNGFKGAYPCLDVVVDTEDDNMMHFTWTISNIVTQTSGAITFLICATTLNVDGTANQAWHTKPCKDLLVAEGMDCIGVEDVEPDPAFLDTKENISNKVQEINPNNTEIQYPSAKAVYDYITRTNKIVEIVDRGNINAWDLPAGIYISKVYVGTNILVGSNKSYPFNDGSVLIIGGRYSGNDLPPTVPKGKIKKNIILFNSASMNVFNVRSGVITVDFERNEDGTVVTTAEFVGGDIELQNNKADTITDDTHQYPNSKAVYDYAVAKSSIITNGVGIDETFSDEQVYNANSINIALIDVANTLEQQISKSDVESAIDFSLDDDKIYNAKAINDTLATLSEMISGLEERIGKLENA